MTRGGARRRDERLASAAGIPEEASAPRARVIGIGQMAAGDDGVGLAVLEWLQASGPPSWIELTVARDDSALIERLQSDVPVVVVDAVLQDPPGQIRVLRAGDVRTRRMSPVSTHGIGVAQVLALARLLAPETLSPVIRIVAVTITRPRRYEQRLSAPVAAAVPTAARRVLAVCRRLVSA